MSMSVKMTAVVRGNNRTEIEKEALALWREYTGETEAELPWSTEYEISTAPPAELKNEAARPRPRFYATVIITDSKVQG